MSYLVLYFLFNILIWLFILNFLKLQSTLRDNLGHLIRLIFGLRLLWNYAELKPIFLSKGQSINYVIKGLGGSKKWPVLYFCWHIMWVGQKNFIKVGEIYGWSLSIIFLFFNPPVLLQHLLSSSVLTQENERMKKPSNKSLALPYKAFLFNLMHCIRP